MNILIASIFWFQRGGLNLSPVVGYLSFGGVVLFGGYTAYEVWRWYGGNRGGLTPGQFRRRLAGGVLLEISLVMWCLAMPLLRGRRPEEQLLYLLTATLLAFICMMLAVREAAFVVRQYARKHGEMIRSLGRSDMSQSTDPSPPTERTLQ